jgi:hypothetical protein
MDTELAMQLCYNYAPRRSVQGFALLTQIGEVRNEPIAGHVVSQVESVNQCQGHEIVGVEHRAELVHEHVQ